MACATKYLVTGLLLCLASSVSANAPVEHGSAPSHVAKRLDTTLRYKLESKKLFRLGSEGRRTEIQLNGDVYIRPLNQRGNVLSITLTNLNITVLRENAEEISLAKCHSGHAPTSASRPFLAVFDENGILKNIKVNRNEDELSVNLKLYGATILQRDIPQILGKSPAVDVRTALTYIGSCPFKDQLLSNEKDNVLIREDLDATECSEVKSDQRNDGLTCAGNTCRNSNERHLKWLTAREAKVGELNKVPTFENVVLDQEISYYPFRDCDTEILANIRTSAQLVSVGQESNIPRFHEGNTVSVNRPRYRNINRNICHSGHGEHDNKNDLRQLYSALSCQQSFAVFYQDIIERAIECNQQI